MPEHYAVKAFLPDEAQPAYRAHLEEAAKRRAIEMLMEKIPVSGKRGNHIYTVEIVQEWREPSFEEYCYFNNRGQEMILNIFISRAKVHDIHVLGPPPGIGAEAFWRAPKKPAWHKRMLKKIAGVFGR